MLTLVQRFKWTHIDYLAALAKEVDLHVAWSQVGHPGAPEQAVREGLRAESVGTIQVEWAPAVSRALADLISRTQPDLVHVMYYNHEELTLLLRKVIGPQMPLVWECRDPVTTLRGASPDSPIWRLEADAINAADAHILASDALRRYLERSHGVDLRAALIVPHAFGARFAGPLSEKLSARDGRTHLALVGTVDEAPGFGRYYVDIIRRLVSLGFVVHSHFHDDGDSLEPYARLAEELDDYHHHPTVSFRDGLRLSEITSSYDLMGVFHELGAPSHNESATLAVCIPSKAVSAWLHGAIPIVTFPHYRGLVELIGQLGIGLVVDDWAAVGNLAHDRDAIARATAACLEHRLTFSHEHQAQRIRAFYDTLLDRRAPVVAYSRPVPEPQVIRGAEHE